MCKLSVIIPAYNEEKYIEPTLEALNNQSISRSNYEIIVCNDNSTDNTCKISKSYADKVIDLKKCDSIAQVKNEGVKHAIGEKLLFIDADTVAHHNLIERIIESDSHYGRPKVVIGDGTSFSWPNSLNKTLNFINPKFTIAGGCCMFFNKKLFNEINGFNENLECLEDFDIELKVMKKKYKTEIIDSFVKTNDRRFRQLTFLKNVWDLVYYWFTYVTGKKQIRQYVKIR